MTTKQELQKRAKRLQKELDELNNRIKELDKESTTRWRAKDSWVYYYIDYEGIITEEQEKYTSFDDYCYTVGNYFKTREEAEEYRDNLITKQKLKDLALRLNKGVELNWADTSQFKHYIRLFRRTGDILENDYIVTCADVGQVYCLDKDFLNKAKQEIGEDKLIKLIKSGI